jgi:hypothetical protein
MSPTRAGHRARAFESRSSVIRLTRKPTLALPYDVRFAQTFQRRQSCRPSPGEQAVLALDAAARVERDELEAVVEHRRSRGAGRRVRRIPEVRFVLGDPDHLFSRSTTCISSPSDAGDGDELALLDLAGHGDQPDMRPVADRSPEIRRLRDCDDRVVQFLLETKNKSGRNANSSSSAGC